ncbi:MAG: P-loop NTPase [Promethearchaeota archaeon]
MVAATGNDDGQLFKIGVVSGKGGVGKSTITAAIAVLMADDKKEFIAVDCDVDAPNLALMFTLQEEKLDIIPVQTTEKARFKEDKCTGCRSCVDESFCVFNAIRWNEETSRPILDELACEGCGACAVLCEFGAFDISPIDSGYVYHSTTTDGFPIVYGETIIGASSSGKTVTETKEHAKNIVGDNATLMIVDGPPGIGCPVLATLTDLNYVVVVMEPFPAAFHDASRIIEVILNFNIPFGIVINKYDAWKEGYDMIVEFIKEKGYMHLGDVPMDMNVPKSVVNMQSIIRFSPESPASVALKKIYQSLKNVTKT